MCFQTCVVFATDDDRLIVLSFIDNDALLSISNNMSLSPFIDDDLFYYYFLFLESMSH